MADPAAEKLDDSPVPGLEIVDKLLPSEVFKLLLLLLLVGNGWCGQAADSDMEVELGMLEDMNAASCGDVAELMVGTANELGCCC
jgi:hypothetical protein